MADKEKKEKHNKIEGTFKKGFMNQAAGNVVNDDVAEKDVVAGFISTIADLGIGVLIGFAIRKADKAGKIPSAHLVRKIKDKAASSAAKEN